MVNTTLSVALLSGKGGVGKTNLTLNLACALRDADFKALLMDCDLGLANLDVLLGITPEGNLQTALLGEAGIGDVLYRVESEGFDVLPAASGVPELTELQPDMRDLLLSRLEPVLHNYDYVFMDLGAGISGTVQTFAALASVRVVLITPEPTSLTDSYALIKVLNNRYGLRDFMVLVNQASSAAEAKASFEKLRGACRHFLHFEPLFLGHVRNDRKLTEAVCRQQPLLRYAPSSTAAQDIRTVAGRLQQLRLSMLDWLGPRPVLQPLPTEK
ncbi:MAG: MinD/ParA family protein [Desulfovibrio sp.]|nr:MinD/ParA family protein [Desulfovibrio sp.]